MEGISAEREGHMVSGKPRLKMSERAEVASAGLYSLVEDLILIRRLLDSPDSEHYLSEAIQRLNSAGRQLQANRRIIQLGY